MKKNLLIIVLGLLLSQMLLAGPVDLATALKTARNFYFSTLNISVNDKQAPDVTSTDNYYTKNKLAYYVVNFSNKGWVIVSADDDYYPVMAYSNEASLNMSNIPSSMTWWLDNQAGDSEKATNPESEYSKSIHNAWTKYSSDNVPSKGTPKLSVSPLLSCRWDQGSPYNFHCPEFSSGPGGKCYAGCVATAMSQIMYYHKYPEHGTGSHSYEHVYYGTISADFGNTYYDWNSMTNIITLNSKEAISTLIFQAGVSVDMNYSPLGSAAFSPNVPNALMTYFGYSNRLKYLEKMDYENEEWCQMIIDNLELQIPVYYSGSGAEGGHAWVCDGVQDTNYFHMNWGWSGSGNGYFYLSSLNSGNGDFTTSQAAVFDITPQFYPYCLGEKQFNQRYKVFNDGSNFSYYWNNTDCTWLIAPDSAEHVYLTFNSFATEEGHDILSVYDGNDASAPLIGQYSGHETPSTIVSSGNKLYLRFVTDSTGQDLGWTITYATSPAGITENNDNKLSVFPNPASTQINIYLPSEMSNPAVTFYNLTGEQFAMNVEHQSSNQFVVDVKDLSQGFYFIKVTDNNTTFTGKLLVQR